MNPILRSVFVAQILLSAGIVQAAVVMESARELPVVQDVDVVVVGGSCGAVSAAHAARKMGMRVYLVTSYDTLGENMAGTLRLWATGAEAESSPLMKALFAGQSASQPLLYTTPLQVKKALDATLLKAEIPFLTGTYATDVLLDEQGNVAGVVMANRSGRQAIRAKQVIDATPRAMLARHAGATAAPFPQANYTVRQVVVSGRAPEGCGKVIPHPEWQPDPDIFKLGKSVKFKPQLFECEMTVALDGSAHGFAEALNNVRDKTFTFEQLDAADRFTFVPPDRIISAKPSEAAWSDVDALNLESFRPANVRGLLVLGALGDVPREVAAELLKPANDILLGARLGRRAALDIKAKAEAPISPASLRGDQGKDVVTGDIREVSGTLTHPYATWSGKIACAARALPVLGETELLIAGGGTTGGPAAVGAARKGVKTIVVEKLYELGGVQTVGMICGYYYGHVRGFTSVIDEGVKVKGVVRSQAKAEWYRSEARKAGAQIWYGCMVVGAFLEVNQLKGVVVVTPEGERGVILAKAVFDATGNADVAAAAGETTEFYPAEELNGQGVGMAVIRLGSGGHNNDFSFVDDTDASDMSFFGLRTRTMTEAGWDVAQLVNSRERRRLVGVFQVSALDFYTARTYPDTFIQHRSRFDLHGTATGDFFWSRQVRGANHPILEANVPYRALLPKRVDGLLVGAIGMSATRDAMSILRMQPDLQNQGYAAALAVSLALKEGCSLRALPIRKLQEQLVADGVLPKSVIGTPDSHPLSEDMLKLAAGMMRVNYDGLQFLMADPQRALPCVLQKYREIDTHSSGRDPAVSLAYAHVLALLGDATGEDELIDWVSKNTWDATWDAGLDAGVNRMSAYILALGRIHSKKAVPAIHQRIMELASFKYARPEHCRVIALAAPLIHDPALVPGLKALLQAPMVSGHAIQMGKTIPPVEGYSSTSDYRQKSTEKTFTLREINLATALFRLGDSDGVAQKILESYANDPRGFYANYARSVLQAKK